MGPESGISTPNPLPPPPVTTLKQKWRGYGPQEFFRRGARKAARKVLPGWLWGEPSAAPSLSDARTLAQLRAVTHLLGHLDRSADRRQAVQARRRRSDREIFERFPLYVVPTYPGDERLFASPAFEAWLPGELPFVHAELGEIMRLED